MAHFGAAHYQSRIFLLWLLQKSHPENEESPRCIQTRRFNCQSCKNRFSSYFVPFCFYELIIIIGIKQIEFVICRKCTYFVIWRCISLSPNRTITMYATFHWMPEYHQCTTRPNQKAIKMYKIIFRRCICRIIAAPQISPRKRASLYR